MDELTVEIANLCYKECEKIINKVAPYTQIDDKDLMNDFLPQTIYFNEIINDLFIKKKKKTTKKCLPCNERCNGRKMDFSQCTRKRKDGTKFCGSHIKNRPNGEIDDDGSCFNRRKGKRGRKRKNINDNVGKDVILTTKKYINGELYLLDQNQVVYNYSQNMPIILGVLKDEQIVSFDEIGNGSVNE
jgi:hypothetical protein